MPKTDAETHSNRVSRAHAVCSPVEETHTITSIIAFPRPIYGRFVYLDDDWIMAAVPTEGGLGGA